MRGPVFIGGVLTAIGDAIAQLVFIKQTGPGGHALTAYLAGTGGTTQSAVNAVSDNPAASAVQITGKETSRGTLKITHKGYADGSDSGAAAISIDLQTASGGSSGTTAGGIFITSTTDNPYAAGNLHMLNCRLSNAETVINADHHVGIGVPVSHQPSAMAEIDLTGSETHHLDLRDGAGTHCYLYTENGALKFRGGTGTITTIAPA